MDEGDAVFLILVALYALWQVVRVARGVESIAAELRAIAEQNRR